MTKEEAKVKLKNGFKIAHEVWSRSEYIKLDESNFLIDESEIVITESIGDIITSKDGWKIWGEKEEIDITKNPHYNNYPKETIDMMLDIFGKEAFKNFCLLNAFKYRMRMGTKENGSIEKDLIKEKYYLDKYNNIK